jgi:hypothetical protein
VVQGGARHQAQVVGDASAGASDDEQPGVEVLADQLVGVCAEEPGLDDEVGVIGSQPSCRGVEYVVSVCQSGPEPDAVFGEGDRP